MCTGALQDGSPRRVGRCHQYVVQVGRRRYGRHHSTRCVSFTLSETRRVDDLAHDIEGLGHSPRRLAVRFSHVGVFTEPDVMLFYGATPTDRLLRVRADVEWIHRRWSSAVSARSQSGVRVPHCTLAGRVEANRFSEAIAAAATPPLPWVAARVRLAIVRFDQ
jgi:2'-5' RNA ligase